MRKNAIRLKRVHRVTPEFRDLVKELNAELAVRDGELHDFYDQYNGITDLEHIMIAYLGDDPVGCAAMKRVRDSAVEVKRMYVRPAMRSQGLGGMLLAELERWASEYGFTESMLETGKGQPEALRLYERSGYKRIENYGPYQGVENSICFQKDLPKPYDASTSEEE